MFFCFQCCFPKRLRETTGNNSARIFASHGYEGKRTLLPIAVSDGLSTFSCVYTRIRAIFPLSFFTHNIEDSKRQHRQQQWKTIGRQEVWVIPFMLPMPQIGNHWQQEGVADGQMIGNRQQQCTSHNSAKTSCKQENSMIQYFYIECGGALWLFHTTNCGSC